MKLFVLFSIFLNSMKEKHLKISRYEAQAGLLSFDVIFWDAIGHHYYFSRIFNIIFSFLQANSNTDNMATSPKAVEILTPTQISNTNNNATTPKVNDTESGNNSNNSNDTNNNGQKQQMPEYDIMHLEM